MSDSPVELDDIFEQCRDRHRRVVLAVLAGEQRSLTILDLTKAILKHGHHVSFRDAPEDTLTGIRSGLHHRHIPKLAASGYVDYDQERHLVEPTSRFHEARPALVMALDLDPDLGSPIAL